MKDVSTPTDSQTPTVQRDVLVILDRDTLLDRLEAAASAWPLGPVWMLALTEEDATMLTIDESRVLFTYKHERERVAVGNRVIAVTGTALGWPTMAHAA